LQVRNDSGGDLPKGSVVCLNELILDDDQLSDFHIWLSGIVPNDTDPYGILRQPLLDGDIGPCQLSGIVLALVNITTDEHGYARVKSGETVLESAKRGPVRILAKSSGDNPRLCAVLLGFDLCLPEQLIRDVRIENDQLLKDVWRPEDDCDQYTPYVIADLSDCGYVPYTPGPSGDPTSSYFDSSEDYEAWTGIQQLPGLPSPWVQCNQSGDLQLCYEPAPGGDYGDPGEYQVSLSVTIGAEGGFCQFNYRIDPALESGGYGPLRFLIDGVEIFSRTAETPAGGFEELTAGPYALTAGAHTLTFSLDGTGTAWDAFIAAVDDVLIWGEE
jgi:hypothetical protein